MRVLIVDDHPLFREGLTVLLQTLEPVIEVVGVGRAEDALSIDVPEEIGLVLLDLNLPGLGGLPALEAVRERFESASVVVVSASEDMGVIMQVLSAGASGFIPKTTDPRVTIQALKLVLANGIYLPPQALSARSADNPPALATPQPQGWSTSLSERQRQVFKRLLQGKANKVIARELDIAEGTVKAHLWTVYQMLGVASRVQAMCRVHELGLMDDLTR